MTEDKYSNLIKIAKKLLESRVHVTAAQELVLKSWLDKLQEEITKLTESKT